ncbi:sigma-54-dependent transcriptional regulator [Pseudochelatococcus contaminans]|uniref:DNA-binding NtrC family response regulator n=1 Tax=Pseudochelatococcus contaminans TaxID=1538103 RepID=A0A7W5Z4T6_9HYPH|nr:sigma-54 dependent transcriptional regulator [Pseudochelatococcus contaminans]MBB3810102.1 DNA-binding NtrC family response regulator [Pseudochelatococcus contaminans]
MSATSSKILIIEDDPILGGAIYQRLELEGFEPVWAQSCAEAIAALKRGKPDFVLSDIVLPDGSGEDVFRKAQPWLGDTPILFATAFGEIDQAVRLVKAGADDYLTKPYDVDELVERIRQRLIHRASRSEKAETDAFALSPVTTTIAEQLHKAAATNLPILLTGETGVGKEVAARYLHAHSSRSGSPFVAVNCGAIPHDLLESQFFGHERGAFTGAVHGHVGYFEEAADGTLLLDEIGELDARLQTALLRVLENGQFRPVGARQDKTFAGRVIAATNADLGQLRLDRKFRADLYYRLSVIEIPLPPLRERRGEIEPLAQRFLKEFSSESGPDLKLSSNALQTLLRHGWPGNIRELRNRLQRAAVFARSDMLEAAEIFPETRLNETEEEEDTLADVRQRAEAELIERALLASHGRIGEAAKQLGISRTTLWKRRGKSKQ